MSQAGKVLHLYVEVRSVAEEDGKLPGRGDDGTRHLMLQCPDILPHSQRSSALTSPSHSPDLSPFIQHHVGGGNHSLNTSKSSTRHSVSFQLQNPDATGSPTQFQRQDLLHDNFGQLLEVLAPGATNPGHHGSLRRTCSSDRDPYQGRMPIFPSSASSGRLTVPSTPTSNRRSFDTPGVAGDEGKTSVVSFGYIEKANVNSMAGHRPSVCQNKPQQQQQLLAQLHKRLSDPVCCNGQQLQDDPFSSHHHLSRNQSPWGSPYLQRTTLDAVARDATHWALEEFGSPDLRCRLAGHSPMNCSPTLPRNYQSPRCRSWGGSPVLAHNTLTLPSKTQFLELDRGVCGGSVNGLPRSPAFDHLCAHSGYSSSSVAPPSALCSHCPAQSQQRPWIRDESPRLSSKFHPPLPAGKPTDIQHEVPTSMFHTSNPFRTGYQDGNSNVNNSYNISDNTTDSKHYSSNDNFNTHYKPSHCSSRASDAISPTVGRSSISPSSNIDLSCKLAMEASKLSSIFAERWIPSPAPSHAESLRSNNPKTETPFLRESQPYATPHKRSSPESLKVDHQNHGWKTDKLTPQTKPGRISPLLSHKSVSSPASPALPARLHRAAASQSPVLDPRHQQSPSPSKDVSILPRYQLPQYTGDHKSPAVERRQYESLFDRSLKDSPESQRTLLSNQSNEALPVSWMSRQQEWMEAEPGQNGVELSEENFRKSLSRIYATSKDDYHKKDGGDNRVKFLGMSKEQREEVRDHSGTVGTSSQSSSGVTGSLVDSSQLDRNDSLSPETSSQSSHDTADGGSGMQVG